MQGGGLGESFVLVTPRLKPGEAQKVGQETTRQVGQSITKAQGGLLAKAKGMGSTIMQGIGVGLGFGVANLAPAILGFGRQLRDLGTEMELLNNKSETVFRDQLPVVKRWADGAASAMGVTRNRAVALAAGVADLLVPMGFARDVAADMATQTIDLAGALSEWSGGARSASEVSTILAKAYLGERDALAELGVKISQAEVDQRALAIAKQTGRDATDQQVQAEATLQLVLEKSTDAQRAYAEGTNTNARRQAELSARIAEVKERLALALVPALGKALGFLLDAGSAAGELGGELGKHPALITAVASAAGVLTAVKLATTLHSWIGGLEGVALRALYTKDAVLKAVTGIRLYHVGIGVAVIALTSWIQKQRDAARAARELADEAKATGQTVEQVALEKIAKSFAESDRMAEDMERLGLSISDLRDPLHMTEDEFQAWRSSLLDTDMALNGTTGSASNLAGRMIEFRRDLGNAKEITDRTAEAQRELGLTTDDTAASTDDGADAQADYAKALEATTSDADDLADAVDLARKAIESLTGATADSDAANMDYQAAIDDLTESVKENGRTFDISTKAGRDNRQAAIDLASSIRELQLAHIRETGDVDAARRSGELYTAALVDQLRRAGATNEEILRLVGTYATVPDDVATTLSAETAGARAKIAAAKADAAGFARTWTGKLDLDTRQFTQKIIDGKMQVIGSGFRLMGRGGLARGGQPGIVGEERGNDELVLPFGHPARLRALFAEHRARLAAVLGGDPLAQLGHPQPSSAPRGDSSGPRGGISVGQLVLQLPPSADLSTPAGARAAAVRLRRALLDLETEDR